VSDITLQPLVTLPPIVDTTQFAQLCSLEFGLPLFDLNALDQNLIPKNLIKSEIIQKHHALPIFLRDNRVCIALTDPTNLKALDEIQYSTNLGTEAILVEEHKFKELAAKIIAACDATAMSELEAKGLEAMDIPTREEKDLNTTSTEDAPIILYINQLLGEAVRMGASDLHFEPYEKMYRIRFRQDGILYEHRNPEVTLGPRLAARIKIMSDLDIAERRIPQDGRFKMKMNDQRIIDFRVSTCPTLYGEKIVMRILDPTHTQLELDNLGLEDFQKTLFLNTIHKPQGMFIVTGPTGSGKTITLYTALNILNQPKRNIFSCEDPIEINLPGINQVNVNIKTGLTFATALRAFLRQDPDVMMVGEIRDLETAEIAIKAAQTGHMVLSTLHTNSAADTLTRFLNMGIPAYNLATSVSLVVAQRLVRKLCNKCKKEISIPKSALLNCGFREEDLINLQLYGPKGCNNCKEGYKERLAIFEMMSISPSLSHLILSGAHAIALYQQALQEGMWDLRRAALNKVKQGLTSLEEINRVIKE